MSKTKTKLLVALMLDSGAFSAWSRDEELPLKDYIAYLKDYKDLLYCYVNMDKIPGKFGRKRTQAEVEESGKVSYANLQKMKDAGLSPVPVFHQDEDFKWLEKMLADGEPYIGFSSGKDSQPELKTRWLDTIFTMICDSQGRPYIKTHGFGITKPSYLLRYPWSTVDSTTWSMTPAYGTIIVPQYPNPVKGPPDYSRLPTNFVISGVEHKSSGMQQKQFEILGDHSRQCLLRFLAEEVGVELPVMRYDSNARRKAVLIYYRELSKHLHARRFKQKTHGFIHRYRIAFEGTGTEHDKTLIMFATSTRNKQWSELLTDLGTNTRLLSYYETRDETEAFMREYLTRGMVGEREPKAPSHKTWNNTYQNYRRLKTLERFNDRQETILAAIGDSESGAVEN